MKTKFVSPDAQGALGILIPAIPGVFDIALAPSRRHGAGRHGTSRETRNQQNTLCLDDDGFATQTGVRHAGLQRRAHAAAHLGRPRRTYHLPRHPLLAPRTEPLERVQRDRVRSPVQLVHAMNHDGL